MLVQSQTKRWPIWKMVFLAAVLFMTYGLVWIYDAVSRRIPESYAAWTTGNLIVDYLANHENQWPRSWEDLDQATNCQRYTKIEALKTKVKIDWEVSWNHLLQSTRTNRSVPLCLVTRPNGKKLCADWGPDTDPNNKIKNYVLWVLTESASYKDISTDKQAESRDSLHPPHQDLLR
jgi:hypothetical protein